MELNQERSSYIPYFVPLFNRTNPDIIKNALSVKPISLSVRVTKTLNSLFPSNAVHLFLPYWSEDGDNIDLKWQKKKDDVPTDIKRKLKVSKPSGYYEIRYSSNNKKQKEFINEYDPLVVLDNNGTYIGTIFKGNLFFLDTASSVCLLNLLTTMSEQPSEFFEILGKRWGVCLCCRKTLTVESSLERAIGPVCYKRIKRIRKVLGYSEVSESDVLVAREEEIDHDLPKCVSLYTPDEADFLSGLNSLIGSLVNSGMTVNSTGLSIIPDGDKGEISLVKPKYKIKQDKELRGVKYIYCMVVRETRLTTFTLYSLGGDKIKITTKYRGEVEVFLFPDTFKDTIGKYFNIVHKKEVVRNNVIDEEDEDEEDKVMKHVHVTEDDNYIYVAGNTYPIKEELKSLGGKWDKSKQAWKFLHGSVLPVDIQSILLK